MKRLNHNYAVILAGGQGSRFWPLSRSLEPKQFLSLVTPKSLLQDTISRIKQLIPSQKIFIITSQLYFPEIFNYTSGFKIPRSNIIFEPESKNTAPSIALTCQLISLIDKKAKIVVLPSDHIVKNQKNFKKLLGYAFSSVRLNNNLVIFGIFPDYPATGYGYIKVTNHKSRIKIYRVEKFIEKPNIKSAARFFKDKRYFWNSGMFLGSVSVFLNEIKKNTPALYKSISKIHQPGDINKIWKYIKAISFDYAVLEKTKKLIMLPALNLGWSDLGNWASLDKIMPKDKLTNTIRADAIISGSKNITVFSKNRLIACLGLENLIIVDTPDALLITRKDKTEEVKKLVERLKRGRRQEVYTHKTVKRPWGRYTVLDKGGPAH